MSWTIGIDLGGSKIALGLVSPDNRIISRRRINTIPNAGPAPVIEAIAHQVHSLKNELPPQQQIIGIGIGAPGPVDHIKGRLHTLVNLPGLSNTPFRQLLQSKLRAPVQLNHDAKVAALGEFHFGAGLDRDSIIYIVIGTGVGAAIIYQGSLIYGESNSAGESGHMTVNPDGHRCHCGSRGCLETYASGPSIAKHYRGATGIKTSGADVTARAQDGDQSALHILHEAGRALGIAIASLAMTLNIERFVIGGSVAKAGHILLNPARATLKDYAFAAVAAKIEIRPSALHEDAPILGAAFIARHPQQ